MLLSHWSPFAIEPDAKLWQVAGVSLCGALKNIVSVAAGLSDGLEYGSNTKGRSLFLKMLLEQGSHPDVQAAIIRIGLLEMKRFCQEFFDGVKDETFLQESAGVADVITSCTSCVMSCPADAYEALMYSFGRQELEVRRSVRQAKQGRLGRGPSYHRSTADA